MGELSAEEVEQFAVGSGADELFMQCALHGWVSILEVAAKVAQDLFVSIGYGANGIQGIDRFRGRRGGTGFYKIAVKDDGDGLYGSVDRTGASGESGGRVRGGGVLATP